MKIKNILNKLLLIVVFFVPLFGIVFGDDCDDMEMEIEMARTLYNECYDNCVAQYVPCNAACEIQCGDAICASELNALNQAEAAWSNCMNNTLGVSGPDFIGEWDGGATFSPLIEFRYHGNNLGNYSQEFDCDGRITVNGGSINNIQRCSNGSTCCYVHITNIPADTNEVTINVSQGVARIGGHLSSGGTHTYTRPTSSEPEPQCDKLPVNGTCVAHGESYVLSGGCCVESSNSQGNGGSVTCPASEQQSPGGCTTYSSASSWYCSMGLEGTTATPGLNLYLNHLDQATHENYLNKFQPQANRFSKLLNLYNQNHPNSVIEHGAGFAGLEQVGSLNRLMGAYGFSHDQNCRLGNATLNTFFTANLCEKIFEGLEVRETNETSCEDGWEWDTYCCIKSESCEKPAVPQTETGTCDSYGPSYTLSGTCCTTQCSIPQKTGGGCNTGYIKDGSGCCIQNNCQNPPLSGTDCSNQFGGRGVYSGAIECCIDSGSCVNPPSSPGQCSGNLVLDQAGQCCITCATPADGSGNCQSGYTVQGSCCFADNMCGDNQINQGGQCKACEEEGTKPNESHTRCICNPDLKCCGVQLNNVVPFIGDCIEMNGESNRDNTTNVTSVTAFPILMQGLMKILMSVIMIFSFLMIIVAGLMIVSGAFGGNGFTTGKKIIKNVIISLILLGCSGLILSLINPSFFGG